MRTAPESDLVALGEVGFGLVNFPKSLRVRTLCLVVGGCAGVKRPDRGERPSRNEGYRYYPRAQCFLFYRQAAAEEQSRVAQGLWDAVPNRQFLVRWKREQVPAKMAKARPPAISRIADDLTQDHLSHGVMNR